MKNQLSTEEVRQLFNFVKSKSVHYIDVQFEIVDHLASAIEVEQASDPNLNFNSALQKIYGKFPITGFAMMILAKEEALSQFWEKRFFGAFISNFSYPKMIMSLILSAMIFFGLDFGDSQVANYLSIIMKGSLIGTTVYICSNNFEMNGGHEKYLFTKTYIQILFAVFIAIFFIPINLVFSEGSQLLQVAELSSFQCWFLTIYYSIAYYFIYAFGFEFPKILKQELKEKYSHLNIKLV
ncbi:MAG: hypothetical protein ACJATI_001713 [Halioglobus sp.]|jgi:hypothetical protein